MSGGAAAAPGQATLGGAASRDVDEPPAAPAAPAATATAGSSSSLDVSWSAPPNTGRPAIESYDLRRREGATGG